MQMPYEQPQNDSESYLSQNEVDFDNSERNSNGVKNRIDGKGDGWANAHRKLLGNQFYFQDVDCFFGAVAFGHNTAERLFLEYVPDDYENRTKKIRQFGIVALFDRKSSKSAAFGNKNIVSCGVYLWLCRTLGTAQGIKPKFYYVIGNDKPPWEMIEMDIDTADIKEPTVILQSVNWKEIWEQLGLLELRNEIKKRLL